MGKIKPEISTKLSQIGRTSFEMLAVALPVFWSMIQLHTWWSPPLNSIVFAVMLGVMLPRAMKRVQLTKLHFAVVAFGIGTAAAIGCGMLIQKDSGLRILGAVLFAAGVALPVWARRFGNVWKASGTLFTIPFMAILVHPVPMDVTMTFFGWNLIAAAVALIWTSIVKMLENSFSKTDKLESKPTTDVKKQGLLSSTKMAIQLAVAVVAAFVCAELVDADHLVWPVLTVLIVHSGNKGRGDLLWKGAQRTAGALIGVTVASLIAVNLPPKNSIEIVAIFAILVFAAGVREFGYLFWAVCIPAALVFLYSFFGQSGTALTTHLEHRLLGIAIGSAVGIASGYFIFPVRMVDVARLRLSAMLSIASDFVVAATHGKEDRISLEKLALADQELLHFNGIAKATRYFGIGAARRLSGALIGAHGLVSHLTSGTIPHDSAGCAALAKEIGTARRSLSFKETGADHSAPDPSDPLTAHIRAIITADLSPKVKQI